MLKGLREKILGLQRALDEVGEVDAETRSRLGELIGDIESHLEAGSESEDHVSLADRARLLAEEFEASHPTLAGAIRNLVDHLAKMGI